MNCHRDAVVELLLAAAKRRSFSLRVVEWPGGKPIELDLQLSAKEWKSIRSGRRTIPLDEPVPLEQIAAIPWGSIVTLWHNEDWCPVFVGPARYEQQGVLPIIGCPEEPTELPDLRCQANRIRQYFGVESRDSQ
jgi:hypothetical protein